MKEKQILLTGFEPFGEWKMNPSIEVARALEGNRFSDEILIIVEEIPVKFHEIGSIVRGLIDNHRPSLILHLGQSNRASLSIERIALNIANVSGRGYNCGSNPKDQELVTGAPAAYFATIPVSELAEHLVNKIPVEISYFAGTYGCNQTLFLSLHHIMESKLQIPVGLIHIPSLPEQVLRNPQTPSMSLNTIKEGIKESLHFLSRWLQSF